MGIIADRAPLGAKPTSGSAARGRGFGEELPNNPEERDATVAAVHESVVGTFATCRCEAGRAGKAVHSQVTRYVQSQISTSL